MPETNAELKFNLVGRLLGKKSLSLRNDALVASANNAEPESYSTAQCTRFAEFKKGWLGGTLTLGLDQPVSYRFLSQKNADDFLQSLNSRIAEPVGQDVEKAFAEFHAYAVREYPRDSRLGLLATLCQTLNKRYNAQAALWERFLKPESLEKAKALASLHPVAADTLREQHERIQLQKRGVFFDQVESNPLTHEQRLGVLRSNDRNMVLAAAGTGKTSVMVAKALDLIQRGLAQPEQILVLAYNRAAANELKERLADKATNSHIALESLPHISTFHALGRKLLQDAGVSTYMSVFTEDDLKFKQWVTSWLETYLTSDSGRLNRFISLFPEPVNPFKFETQAAYEHYVRDNEFRTLQGEKVKGYQELLIANFMYLNSVGYTYEAPYVSKQRIDIGFDYRPDFHLTGTTIYIEHFGVDRQGRTRPDIDAEQYNQSMLSKRELHLAHETTLVETYHYEWIEETLLPGLKDKLEAQGIVCTPLDPEAVFAKLNEQGRISHWAELLKKALLAIRVERQTRETMHERFKKAGIAQPDAFVELLDALHQGYIDELNAQNSIDFDDMIIRAIQTVHSGQNIPAWTYILVDEFQDISAARMELIQALIDKGPQPSLTVVGDDWQSIYRFSGGKLELTTRFGEMVGDYTATKLQKTFRYNNSIASTAGQFIMENPEQYKKAIETHTQVDQSQVYLLDDKAAGTEGIYARVEEIVQKIRSHEADSRIAVIARYNYLLDGSRAVLSGARLQKNVSFWSFHKAKGLEADYAILIGFFQGRSGFPNENRDEAIIEALLPSRDAYPHSEERRLLYVGITRAKKKVYIIADPMAPSGFVTEMLSPKYELSIASKAFQETYRKIFKCPNCESGYLRLMKGQYGEFYACSTGFGCRVGKARVCTECRSPSVDTRSESICNNKACGHTLRICEKCGRPMKQREGKFGVFWGCSGYGIPDDQCTHTKQR